MLTAGVAPSVHVEFKHTDLKQHWKGGGGLRTETSFNDPTDVRPTEALAALPHLHDVGSHINTRLLEAERLSQTLIVEPALVARVQQPVLTGRQRVPALRLGDARGLALLQSVCHFADLPNGVAHRDRRRLVASLLGRNLAAYSGGMATMRLHGVIAPAHFFGYVVTPDGMRLAFGLSRICLRLLQSRWADLPAPSHQIARPLGLALVQLDAALRRLRADDLE